MEVTGVLSTNLLAELGHLSRIDGMAAFAGTDGLGREFTVLEDELPVYIANTQRVLNSTKDTGGEIVGLPIDMGEHDWNGGAGWIVGLELDAPRKIIIFAVNWTEDGVECIAGNMMRFFSPAFDTEKKIIMGGALLNQPGSRNAKGQYLLRPVELSKSMSTIQKEKDMTVETSQDTKPAWAVALETAISELSARFAPKKPDHKQEPTAESIRELMQSDAAVVEMARIANERVANQVAIYERQQHVIKLASDMVGGTPSRPFGLAGIRAEEIVELLMGVPMAQSLATLQNWAAPGLATERNPACLLNIAAQSTNG